MPPAERHPDAAAPRGSGPLRIGLVQPLTPHYRVPVFERLAALPGVELEVWSDMEEQAGSLQSVRGEFSFVQHNAPTRMIGPFVTQPRQRDAVRAGYDVVILPGNTRYIQLLPSLRYCRRAGIPTILWGHGYSKSEARWRKWLRHRAMRSADSVLLYNHTAARRLVDEGFPADRVFAAPNSIDQEQIESARRAWLDDPAALDRFRAEQGLVGHDLVVFISRMEPDKRVDLLVDAFATVVKRRPTARLALIGGGSEREALRARAERLGIADRVTFTGPLYEEREMAPWCLCASCMAYPAAIGLSILHAFGYGLPVVTSDDIPSHNPEIEALRPDENGLLFADGDAADLATTILRLVEDETLRATMSDAALATVRSHGAFTLDRMIDGFRAAIAAALARHGRRWGGVA